MVQGYFCATFLQLFIACVGILECRYIHVSCVLIKMQCTSQILIPREMVFYFSYICAWYHPLHNTLNISLKLACISHEFLSTGILLSHTLGFLTFLKHCQYEMNFVVVENLNNYQNDITICGFVNIQPNWNVFKTWAFILIYTILTI